MPFAYQGWKGRTVALGADPAHPGKSVPRAPVRPWPRQGQDPGSPVRRLTYSVWASPDARYGILEDTSVQWDPQYP
jgi:hypothetical protein